MSKCLKCGAPLPPVGECPTCAAASQPAGRAVPNLLDREIHIDRRRPDRAADSDTDSEAETLREQPLPVPAKPPGMVARAPVSSAPGAVPRAPASAPAPRPPAPLQAAPTGLPPPPPRAPGLPVMPPRPQAVVVPQPLLVDEDSVPLDIDVEEPVVAARPPPPAPAPRPRPTAAPAPVSDAEVHARPASLWRRLLAFGIDASAICGVVALYLLLATSVASAKSPTSTLTGLDAFLVQVRALKSVLIPGALLLVVLSLVYCTLSAVLWNGRTLGRGVLGLRLVDMRGQAPAPGRAIVRALLATVSFGFFLAGFWMALFDRRGQTLHDKLTSTYVVQPS